MEIKRTPLTQIAPMHPPRTHAPLLPRNLKVLSAPTHQPHTHLLSPNSGPSMVLTAALRLTNPASIHRMTS